MGWKVTNAEGEWVYPDELDADDAHAAWLADHATDADQSVVIAPWAPPTPAAELGPGELDAIA